MKEIFFFKLVNELVCNSIITWKRKEITHKSRPRYDTKLHFQCGNIHMLLLFTGYTPDSNSYSSPRINTPSRLSGFGPLGSHTPSPLHLNTQSSPYTQPYLSSSVSQRGIINGATPNHPLGGTSSGYHVNGSGITNGISLYQSLGGVSESYYANGNFSVHTTPPTRD
ncbi:uncharacterized protein LOC130046514 [Ostrea edulis]|uniref:uncharacterized protein LOC130046514 n=1 Tax=Ostrea edulis TaxID=37623 RepID=UPI0024AF4801|nr:uncharacterized protein LOC130046514 [Ostrea edulis]